MQSFKKYMTFKKDFNAIVLHLLNQLVKEALHFEEIVSGSNKDVTHVDVKVEELQSKVINLVHFLVIISIKYASSFVVNWGISQCASKANLEIHNYLKNQ